MAGGVFNSPNQTPPKNTPSAGSVSAPMLTFGEPSFHPLPRNGTTLPSSAIFFTSPTNRCLASVQLLCDTFERTPCPPSKRYYSYTMTNPDESSGPSDPERTQHPEMGLPEPEVYPP